MKIVCLDAATLGDYDLSVFENLVLCKFILQQIKSKP